MNPLQATSSPELLANMQCYDDRGRAVLQLESTLSTRKHVRVFVGHRITPRAIRRDGLESITDRNADEQDQHRRTRVFVKLYSKRKNATEHEIAVYKRMGEPLPFLPMTCFLWNVPVLVMSKMKPLTDEDDAYEVGVQILDQLKQLHTVVGLTHSDLKPQNILEFATPNSTAITKKDTGPGRHHNRGRSQYARALTAAKTLQWWQGTPRKKSGTWHLLRTRNVSRSPSGCTS